MAHGREPGVSGSKRFPGEDTRFSDRVGGDRGAAGEGGGRARDGGVGARLGFACRRETPRRVLHGECRCCGVEGTGNTTSAGLHGAIGVRAAGRVAADAERQAGPARTARAGGRRVRPRRIRSAAGRKGRSTGRDLAGAAACGAHQPSRQFLRTRRAFAARDRLEREASGGGLACRRACRLPGVDAGRSRRASGDRQSGHPDTTESDCRRRRAHYAGPTDAGGAEPGVDRRVGGEGGRRCGERAGHLSVGAVAGRHSVSSPDVGGKRSVRAVGRAGVPQPRGDGAVCVGIAAGDRSARHPAHRLFLGGTRATGAGRAAPGDVAG
ncbi:Uncharacterised protein [Burkholderia pseudomallei]|nr:Uncharacterised protein [Burkholderia pseudomallei]VBH26278.1 Uncharacterised protein [Burkholderia pseudomallei]VBN79876.1 Uncharacterised protein [Burkholderia pseudomallei]VBO19251.1 Uncharacterised protein [Burkholderia pseudomallei]